MAPLVKMHTLGHDFIPEPIHAGGLRYHGMSPAGEPPQGARLHRGAQRPPAGELRGGRASSPAPRASSRRRSRPTRSASRSTRPSRPARPARPRSSCSTCAATATSTCRRTSATSPGDARGLRVPGREGRGRARLAPGGLNAATRVPGVRPPDLHGGAARVALRRGAPLSALRRVAQRGAPRHRAAPP